MASSIVLSNQLIPFVLRASNLDESFVVQIVERLSDSEVDRISLLLSEVLRQEAACGRMKIINPATGQPEKLKSILFNADSVGTGAVKIVAFSFSHAAQESLVAVFGLVVTAFSEQWTIGSLSSGLALLRVLWSNVSVLQSPQDDNAIAVVRAIGLCHAQDVKNPNNAQLQKVSGLSPDQVATALKQLTARKIIKNYMWGSQSDDFAHSDNRWTIQF